MARALLPHTGRQQGPMEKQGLAGCIPGLSFGHQAGQCGQQRPQSLGKVRRRAVGPCTAHIPQGILFCSCLGGCSQRKSVTRRGQEPLLAPREHLTGSSGTDRRPHKARTSNSVVWQMSCRVLLRPGDAANTRDNHLGSGANAGQENGSPPSSTPAWHQNTACKFSKVFERPFPGAEQPLLTGTN